MRGVSGWFGAASAGCSSWRAGLLKLALGQELPVAASKSGHSTNKLSRPPKGVGLSAKLATKPMTSY